jgi:aldehyde dehydrogenase (NAD+)
MTTTIDTGVRMTAPPKLFVDGEWRDAEGGRTQPTLNPADGSEIADIAHASVADLNRAVLAARRAFDEGPWPRMAARERARVLLKVADLIERDAEEIAVLETVDMGKPIMFSAPEASWVAGIYRYFAGLVGDLGGVTRPNLPQMLVYTRREPIGVVGAITPFNHPLVLSAAKLAPALATGNVVVHKPSEVTPLSALKIAALFAEAGLPAGVLNVVTGPGAELGEALVAHPAVDKISFTGSTAIGQGIIRASADGLKKVTMELGGKSANIIFADAYLDQAVQNAFFGIFYNKGEICTSGSRLLVQRPVYDQVVSALVEQAGATRPGDPLDPSVMIGPLAHAGQFNKVSEYAAIGRDEDRAELLVGGGPAQVAGGERGFYFEPTIFGNVRNDMRIAQEEIFGPVLAVIPFDTEEEAIAIANGTRYGLASGVHTSDIRRGHRVAAAMRAGTCWINTYNQFDPAVSFGGYKASGYGREFGPESLNSYTQTKSVWLDQSV